MEELQSSQEQTGSATEPLGKTAYIIIDNAECRYSPEIESPARVIPPYGSEVVVLQDRGDWVQIQFCGKHAWAERRFLAQKVPGAKFDISPYLRPAALTFPIGSRTELQVVEYGPRGGRFTRTKTGFRRYF